MDWLARRFGVTGLGVDGVLPVIGSKELIASLPSHLGLGSRRPGGASRAGLPDLRGGRTAGRGAHAGQRRADGHRAGAGGAGLPQLALQPDRARAAGRAPAQGGGVVPGARGAAGLRRVLPRVLLGDGRGPRTGVGAASRRLRGRPHRDPHGALAVQAVQPRWLPLRLRCRRPPRGRGAAGGAAQPGLDDARAAAARDAGRARRRRACRGAAHPLRPPAGRPVVGRGVGGLRVDFSEGALYLWATRGEPCWQTVGWFAELGILVAPGDFYGPAGAEHVRIAITATDERVAAACSRLAR